jgi:hypothetical protein
MLLVFVSSMLLPFVHHRAQGEVSTHSCEGQNFIQAHPGISDEEGEIHAVQDDEHQEGDHQDQHDQWPDIGCQPGGSGLVLDAADGHAIRNWIIQLKILALQTR